MGSHDEIERGSKWLFDFTKLMQIGQKIDPKNPVIPVVVQDGNTKEVLICAYANEDAVKITLETGIATFWSTSRNELWVKGKTSGDVLNILEVRVNCEQNSLLYIVNPVRAGACHVKDKNGKTLPSCYYRRLQYNAKDKSITLDKVSDAEL